jgi:hypothetical protein
MSGAGGLKHLGRGREPLVKLLGHASELGVHRGGIGLGEDRVGRREDVRVGTAVLEGRPEAVRRRDASE